MSDVLTVAEWYIAAPPAMREWMLTPDFLNFLRDQHAKAFQMAGMYDGAMSEQCKQLFRDQHAAIGSLRIAIAVGGEVT